MKRHIPLIAVLLIFATSGLQAQSCDISGLVFLDKNSSGILDSGDIPQPAVRVYLYLDNNQDGILDVGDSYVSQDFTDAGGGYNFSVGCGSIVIDEGVSTGNDDAEERISDGQMDRNDSKLEMIDDGGDDQLIGLRFDGLALDYGATITSAYLQFKASDDRSAATSLSIDVENSITPSSYSGTDYDISSRTTGGTPVPWNSIPAWSKNTWYNSPDITSLVQSIVNTTGWSNGNAMAFVISGSGERRVYSQDQGSSSAPRLVVAYQSPTEYLVVIETDDLSPGHTLTTPGVYAASISGGSDTTNTFGYSGTSAGCYVHDDGNDDFHMINRHSGYTEVIGNTGVPDIEAIAAVAGGGTLFGADADQLGVINRYTGNFTPTSSKFGYGSGGSGSISINDVDGLVYDPTTNILFGASRRSGAQDVLVKIDTATGKVIPDGFGAGIDYVEINGTGLFQDIDDLAVDPTTGDLYGVNNDGGTNDYLVYIDKTTGVSTIISSIGVDDVEGLGITNDGLFYATTGSAGGANSNKFWEIDKITGTPTLIKAFPVGYDFESCDCLLGDVSAYLMPVVLSWFTAKRDEGQVLLNWESLEEVNNSFYTLQRSGDGFQFEDIARIPANGDQGGIYEHIDRYPLPGTNYYRLKQTDFSGETQTLGLRLVVFTQAEAAVFSVYPNPSLNGAINIQLTNADDIINGSLKILDYRGTLVEQRHIEWSQGMESYHLEFQENLPAGIYHIYFSTGRDEYHQRLVVQ